MSGPSEFDEVVAKAMQTLGADEVTKILDEFTKVVSGEISKEEFLLGDLCEYIALCINEDMGMPNITATVEGGELVINFDGADVRGRFKGGIEDV